MQPTPLDERLKQLESDLEANPPRISSYSELPCALFRYDPQVEWELRRELRKLATRLGNRGKSVQMVSLAGFVWKAIDDAEGLDPIVQLETSEGWEAAQRQVNVYLSDPDFLYFPRAIADRLTELESTTDLVFLWRAAALSPGIYFLSKLLDELKGRLAIPTVLFYPGVFDDQGLRFMGLLDRETTTNYRVKIYH